MLTYVFLLVPLFLRVHARPTTAQYACLQDAAPGSGVYPRMELAARSRLECVVGLHSLNTATAVVFTAAGQCRVFTETLLHRELISTPSTTYIYRECLAPCEDCYDWLQAGHTSSRAYSFRLGGGGAGFEAYCDMSTEGGGWMAFQRRLDGTQDFYQDWANYRDGFGDTLGEYWLGNQLVHTITSSREHDLLVKLATFDDQEAYALYTGFTVGPEDSFFVFNYNTFVVNSTAGDGLDCARGRGFTTWDSDHDGHLPSNCAVTHKGGYWFASCTCSNLNARWLNITDYHTIYWKAWKGIEGLRNSSMMMRPA